MRIDSLIDFKLYSDSKGPVENCLYCGCKLKDQEKYCSKLCKEKDSVWHGDED